jgi:hypothetical protein
MHYCDHDWLVNEFGAVCDKCGKIVQ